MKKIFTGAIALTLAAVLMVGASAAPADDVTASGGAKKKAKVQVGNNFFSPENVKLKRKGKITFKWDGGGAPHDVTKLKGPGGSFGSDTTSQSGFKYKKKFKKKGKYTLYCTIHPSSMVMKVKVK